MRKSRDERRKVIERKHAWRRHERDRETTLQKQERRRRQRELDHLREKHRGEPWTAPLPDLTVEQRTAPTSDVITETRRWETRSGHVPGLAVGALHKSGLQVLRTSELTAASRKV